MVVLTLSLLPAQQLPVTRRNFVACPIVRDTKTSPCWLAEYKGELYFLGIQGGVAQDFYPPQLEHQVLVEGIVATGPKVCGGIPMQQVKLSVLPEIDQSCNSMLPAEDAIEAPGRSTRTPGESWFKAEGAKTTIYFDFDNDFLSLHSSGALMKVVADFKKGPAASVAVTGYRAATRLSSGSVMTEKTAIAKARSTKVAESLIGLGIPASAVKVQPEVALLKPDGGNDAWNRRVIVEIRP